MTTSDEILAAYDANAAELAARYDGLSAEACWAPVRDLIPVQLGRLALDMGYVRQAAGFWGAKRSGG